MKKGFCLWVIWMLSLTLSAQDPYYSQIFSNRTYLNPALTGANKGLRIAMIHRQLWPNVPGPFHTTGFAADVTEPAVAGAIGIFAMNDNRGEGFLSTNQAGITYAYRNLIGKNGRTEFSLATSVSMVSKFIDWSKLEFSDEFDPVLGKVYKSAAQQPANTSFVYPDFDAGVSFNHKLGRYSREAYLGWGAAVHHMTRPDESFIGVNRRLPLKKTIYLGAMIPTGNWRSKTPTLYFPHFVYMEQGQKAFDQVNFQTVQAGCLVYKDWYFVGLDYRNSPYTTGRNTDAAVLSLGMHNALGMVGSYQITYSLDFSLNGMRGQTWGSHEISLILTFDEYRLGENPFRPGGSSGSKKPINCFDFPHRGEFKMF